MKKFFLLLAFALPVRLLAQNEFTVTGIGSAFKNGDRIYLVYKPDGVIKFDSTLVVQNKFQFKGSSTKIAKATIYQNENPMTADVVKQSFDFYVEPGEIIVTAADSLIRAEARGTQINVDLMVLNKLIAPYQKALITIYNAFDKLPADQQKNIDNIASMRAQARQVNMQMAPTLMGFVSTHPSSYISLEAINMLKRNNAIMPGINAAYNSLDFRLKQLPYGMKLGQELASLMQSATGDIAIDFEQPTPSGKMIRLSDFKGKYVLIDFWASWCGPCRLENPNVVAAYRKFEGHGFTVLGVSLDDVKTKKAWINAIKTDKLTWTQVSDLKGWKNEAVLKYGIATIPANILIDPAGRIVARDLKDKVLLDKLAELMPASK